MDTRAFEEGLVNGGFTIWGVSRFRVGESSRSKGRLRFIAERWAEGSRRGAPSAAGKVEEGRKLEGKL